MVRKSLNPSNLPDRPNPTDDKAREEELIKEFTRRLKYIEHSYWLAKSSMSDANGFNQGLRQLKAAVNGNKGDSKTNTRLYPDIEILVNLEAQRIRSETDGSDVPLSQKHIDTAARSIATKIKPRRKRPGNEILRYHVEALIALVIEFGGQPVTGNNDRNSDYDPHLSSGNSQILKVVFQKIDPTVTETTLVNIVKDARRKYAGKPMCFLDFFPFYGSGFDEKSGLPVPALGYKLHKLVVAEPIYSP